MEHFFPCFFSVSLAGCFSDLPGDQAGAESLARAFGLHKCEAEFLAQWHNEMFVLSLFAGLQT